jgi:excisionase family DNA binding protein
LTIKNDYRPPGWRARKVPEFPMDDRAATRKMVMPLDDRRGDAVPEMSATVRAKAAVTARLLSTEQAAQYVGVSTRTVKNLMSGGQIHYVKIGRSTRLDPIDLDAFIARNRRKQRHRRRPVN